MAKGSMRKNAFSTQRNDGLSDVRIVGKHPPRAFFFWNNIKNLAAGGNSGPCLQGCFKNQMVEPPEKKNVLPSEACLGFV